jgi:hypothetical protein
MAATILVARARAIVLWAWADLAKMSFANRERFICRFCGGDIHQRDRVTFILPK